MERIPFKRARTPAASRGPAAASTGAPRAAGVGNQATQHRLKAKRASSAASAASAGAPILSQRAIVQPDLKLDPAHAAFEREADQVAAAVGSRDQSPTRVQPALATGTVAEPSLAGSLVRASVSRAQGGGTPLPPAARAAIEQKLGADFGGVRVHYDTHANRLAQSLGANAFTVGNDVFFNQARYNPESPAGQALLAHELTHVAQQGGNAAGPIQCDLMESLAPTALGGFEIGMQTRGAPASPGMEGTIVFHPDPSGPYSTEITLIQAARLTEVTPASAAPFQWTGGEAPRNEVRTPLGGTFIDSLYANDPQSSSVTPNYVQAADMAARPTQNYHGWLRSATDVHEASLYDYPNWTHDSDFAFETVAKGSDNQVVYGSLDWGFQIRGGVVQNEYRNPHALESAEFDEALERFRGYYTHEPIVLYYDTDRDLPKSGESAKLADVTSYMSRYPDVRVQVDGYADETGPANATARANYNLDLSLRRADNAVTLLTRLGVDASRIDIALGRGQTTTFAPGSPAAAPGSLAANRRVVISFVRTATSLINP